MPRVHCCSGGGGGVPAGGARRPPRGCPHDALRAEWQQGRVLASDAADESRGAWVLALCACVCVSCVCVDSVQEINRERGRGCLEVSVRSGSKAGSLLVMLLTKVTVRGFWLCVHSRVRCAYGFARESVREKKEETREREREREREEDWVFGCPCVATANYGRCCDAAGRTSRQSIVAAVAQQDERRGTAELRNGRRCS